MIDNRLAGNEPIPSAKTLVGVLFPAHGFMPLWSMLKFLLKMRRQKDAPLLDLSLRGVFALHGLLPQKGRGSRSFLGDSFILHRIGSVRVLFALSLQFDV
jgi:hypothetical protein